MAHDSYPKPADQQTFDYLHDLGQTDPVFGPSGELDVRSHAEEVQAGLLAVAQAAHDQVIGQGEQSHVTATGERIDIATGSVYLHDDDTNTAYRISTSDPEGGEMRLRITSATAYDRHAQAPEFFKRHDLKLTYRKDGQMDDPVLFGKRSVGAESTAIFDEKTPSAFLAMADSIGRARAITQRDFERQDERSKDEFITGQIGRTAFIRTLFGMKPKGKPFDYGDK